MTASRPVRRFEEAGEEAFQGLFWRGWERYIDCVIMSIRAILSNQVRKKGCQEEVLIRKEVGAREP
jgi:hypothetical protein